MQKSWIITRMYLESTGENWPKTEIYGITITRLDLSASRWGHGRKYERGSREDEHEGWPHIQLRIFQIISQKGRNQKN